jgi:hypothetical protein
LLAVGAGSKTSSATTIAKNSLNANGVYSWCIAKYTWKGPVMIEWNDGSNLPLKHRSHNLTNTCYLPTQTKDFEMHNLIMPFCKEKKMIR